MYSQRTILGLVEHIYAAAENESLWPVFLEKFAHVLQAQISTLYIHDLRTHSGTTDVVVGMDPAYDRTYRAYYAPKNVYMTEGGQSLTAGNVMTSQELCSDDKMLSSEFYNDWVRPQGLLRGLNGVLFNEGPLAGSIGAIRSRAVKSFAARDKRFLWALMPHLQRAVKLRRRITELANISKSTSDALDHWATAVFVVNRQGRIVLANQQASGFLRKSDGLTTGSGALQATNFNDAANLRRLIQTTTDGRSSGGAMLIARPSGKGPLQILVSPSIREDLFFSRKGTALVFVFDPEIAKLPQTDVLQHLYGLTPAEAQIATLLASGVGVKEIAEKLKVRQNTVRIHLKNIYDKTGARRQAELVRLVLSGPAALNRQS